MSGYIYKILVGDFLVREVCLEAVVAISVHVAQPVRHPVLGLQVGDDDGTGQTAFLHGGPVRVPLDGVRLVRDEIQHLESAVRATELDRVHTHRQLREGDVEAPLEIVEFVADSDLTLDVNLAAVPHAPPLAEPSKLAPVVHVGVALENLAGLAVLGVVAVEDVENLVVLSDLIHKGHEEYIVIADLGGETDVVNADFRKHFETPC